MEAHIAFRDGKSRFRTRGKRSVRENAGRRGKRPDADGWWCICPAYARGNIDVTEETLFQILGLLLLFGAVSVVASDFFCKYRLETSRFWHVQANRNMCRS